MDERDAAWILQRVRQYWEHEADDLERDHDLYHADAVLEFPQSGERYEGVQNFREWRHQYPAQVSYDLGTMRAGDGFAVVELRASYDGGPPMFGVQILEFRGDLVSRERIYVAEGWEPPEWRARWRSAAPAGR